MDNFAQAGKVCAMQNLRNNIKLARLLIGLFVLQFFVPLAVIEAAKAQDTDIELTGFVICTSSGLKHLTAQGTLQDVSRSDAARSQPAKTGQASCFVCLTGGCSYSITADDFDPLAGHQMVALRLDRPLMPDQATRTFSVLAKVLARPPPQA